MIGLYMDVHRLAHLTCNVGLLAVRHTTECKPHQRLPCDISLIAQYWLVPGTD